MLDQPGRLGSSHDRHHRAEANELDGHGPEEDQRADEPSRGLLRHVAEQRVAGKKQQADHGPAAQYGRYGLQKPWRITERHDNRSIGGQTHDTCKGTVEKILVVHLLVCRGDGETCQQPQHQRDEGHDPRIGDRVRPLAQANDVKESLKERQHVVRMLTSFHVPISFC